MFPSEQGGKKSPHGITTWNFQILKRVKLGLHHVYFRLKKQRGKKGGSWSARERRKGGKKRRGFVWRRNARWEFLLSSVQFWDCFWKVLGAAGIPGSVLLQPHAGFGAQGFEQPSFERLLRMEISQLPCSLWAGTSRKWKAAANFANVVWNLYDFILILCICMCFPIKDPWAVHMWPRKTGPAQPKGFC